MNIALDTSRLDVLDNFFEELSDLDKKKIFSSAYRKASLPLVQAAKALVPRRTGRLAGSIGTIFMYEDSAALIGTKLGRGGSLGHIFEHGTKERFRRSKTGTGGTGKIIGLHFMEKAFEATDDKVYSMIETEWYDAIERLIKRTNKK
jgi:hypothetical protein